MGSYAVLNIGAESSYTFMSYKNAFGDLLILFTMDDLRVKEIEEDGAIYTKLYYTTSVKKAKQCLDLLGYTIEKARETFENSKTKSLEFIHKYSIFDGRHNIKLCM